MKQNATDAVGYIAFRYVDRAANEFIDLGGGGWPTRQALTIAWQALPSLRGESDYIADRLDAEGDIIETKPVGKTAVEAALGQSIDDLLAAGRARLAGQQEELRAMLAAKGDSP